jgi:hypothetical protein
MIAPYKIGPGIVAKSEIAVTITAKATDLSRFSTHLRRTKQKSEQP